MREPLLQIVDAAFASAAARSGPWLLCKPGCSQCCHGAFAISALDAERLRKGIMELEGTDPERARRIGLRVREAVARLAPQFPGDPMTGELGTTEEEVGAFEEFANEEPCPVLDPASQTCDLYAARPMLCRTFGPPLKMPGGGLAICDLCFDGASPSEIEACQMDPVILHREAEADEQHAQATGDVFQTTVAFALAQVVQKL